MRVRACGKFLAVGGEKLYLRGVTYGTFAERPDGSLFPPPERVAEDFAQMAAAGVNTVRTYTVPPAWLLDLAGEHALRILVGIPWEQHLTFLDGAGRPAAIERTVRAAVRACAGHPAVLAFAIGNEIPASIVRWHGRRAIERFLERLYRAAKAEDPDALVTYANYPSTEYLHLPFLDFLCLNVFLEDKERLAAYLARLQVLAGDRPLVVTELGLDSRRNGLERQAHSVAMQIRTAFAAGCAGCFVFSWTDEWTRGGDDVDDWDFGLVDRARRAKPALAAVAAAFGELPFSGDPLRWPSVSVVVCTFNGSGTIAACVEALLALDYPRLEIAVVDDGSTDGAGDIAAGLGVRVLRTPNRGLSAARNAGIAGTTGEILAFCDDDCCPDRDWLRYLVGSLQTTTHAGIGGPNVPPPDSLVADAVGHAPGGPMHVLVSDTEAEHIPGCNMAFRRSVLEEIDGFDPQFRVAGDDVDLCWRIENAGGTLGFSPSALVWHRARGSVRAYLRQQAGYGRAEALLERKWPHRYNGRGHLEWSGDVYGGKVRRALGRWRWRVYYGAAGSSPFQSVYSGPEASGFPAAPEWYLLLLALCAAALAGVPLAALGVAACLLLLTVRAAAWAAAVIVAPTLGLRRRAALRGLIFVLCLLQPAARLWGRTLRGLTPWRRRGPRHRGLPRTRRVRVWSEHWRSGERWLDGLEATVLAAGARVGRGGDFDTWDREVSVGAFASARLRMGIEEHGGGRQMACFRAWPRWPGRAAALVAVLALMAALAVVEGGLIGGVLLGGLALWLASLMVVEGASSVAVAARAAAAAGGAEDSAAADPEPAEAPHAPLWIEDPLPQATAPRFVREEQSDRVIS